MDGMRFDAATRGLANATSRRRMLGGALGGFLAVLTGASAFAARNKRRHGDKGDAAAEDVTANSALVGGIWENTLEICQFDAEGGYEIIAVPMPYVPDYLNKGAVVHIDCCVDDDCGWRECLAPSGCVEGACMYDATTGAECNAGEGLTGVCNEKGNCIANTPPPEEPVVTTGGEEAIAPSEPVVTTAEESFPAE
jgi:hypothetical protein